MTNTAPEAAAPAAASLSLTYRLPKAIREALPEGFTFDPEESTGGGCTAISATAPDGRYLLVTDDASVPGDDSDDVVVGYYSPEGEQEGYVVVDADVRLCVNVARLARLWAAGTPESDR